MTGERRTCSRAGCRETATSAIRWRNPRIHTEGRSKTWLACTAHAAFLTDFLTARGFPLEVDAVEPAR